MVSTNNKTIDSIFDNSLEIISNSKVLNNRISDSIDAILKSLTNKKAKGQIINIGSGKPKKIKNIIEYVKKISKGGYPQFGKIKLRKDEILKVYPNIKKAKILIKWKPKIQFEKGLKDTIKFYNE